MAVTTEIPWGDGSSDKIYLTRDASEGNQTVLVSSDANTGAARSKVVIFSASGASPVSLTVSQDAVSTPNYLVYGSPTISDNIFTPAQDAIGFIYTNVPFNPGNGVSWTIQTKIKMNSYIAWRDIISSVNENGTGVRAIELQSSDQNSGRQYRSYQSNNGTSWNVYTNATQGNLPLLTAGWVKIQFVCTYASNKYTYKVGYPDASSWTSPIQSNTHGTYGKYISFGGGLTRGINAQFDLSETKIWIGGELWWTALNQ